MELIQTTVVSVTKRDGSAEPFSREMIRKALDHAFEKRVIRSDYIDEITEKVEESLLEGAPSSVTSVAIGEEILRNLRAADEVAYLRFASVFRDFSGVNDFLNEITMLSSQGREDSSEQLRLFPLEVPLPKRRGKKRRGVVKSPSGKGRSAAAG